MKSVLRLLTNSFSKFINKRILFNLALEKAFFYLLRASKIVRFKFSNPLFGIDITRDVELANADIIHFHWTNNGFLSLNSLEENC